MTIKISLLSVILMFGLPPAWAQSPKSHDGGQKGDEHMQDEMIHAAPGAIHKNLANMAGEYTTVTKFYMQAGTPAAESTGTARITSVLDGRFLNEEDTGTFMGQPMKSLRILGYNNASKRYEAVWTYTMSTAMMTLGGESPDGGKTIKLTGTFDDVGAKRNLDVVIRLMDDSHFEVSLVGKMPDGSPGPTMVTTYARKK
jgi:uncharacterized protein DUF1579